MTGAKPLVVTVGDPAGIGPEIVCEAWSRRHAEKLPPFWVIASAPSMEEAARSRGIFLQAIPVDTGDPCDIFPDALPVTSTVERSWTPGAPDPGTAGFALKALQAALKHARDGTAAALVTGPVSKAALAEIDPGFIGQTEACADACGVPREDAVMMLAGPSLRTVPMTVHCAISEVPGRLSSELIIRRARIVARALHTDFGIADPRIAIAGLNPHAGENGRMGREEIDIIAPAIARLRSDGIDATGPHPADTLFAAHRRNTYDVAIAMYHDQALVPLKALDFDCGVNMTLGLPIVRTSPDHGTAFDIAGKGIASADSMIAAIRMAGEAAAMRARG